LQLKAVDPDGEALVYSANILPPSLKVGQASGLITGTLAYNAAADSPYTVTVTVTDPGGLSDQKTFQWQVANTNRPPVLEPVGDQQGVEGGTVALPVTARDPDGDAYTFSAAQLPAGLTIDPHSGLIGGVIACGSAGSYSVTVTVTDQGQPALADSETFAWTVSPGACQPAQHRLFIPALLRQ
jgi:hypothetical protein